MERYRLEVGSKHEVKAGNIVGAIANESGLDSSYIRKVTIYDTYSTVDLPTGMPKDIFRVLKKTWVAGRQLNITHVAGSSEKNDSNKGKKRKSKNKSGQRKNHNRDRANH